MRHRLREMRGRLPDDDGALTDAEQTVVAIVNDGLAVR